MKKNFLVVEDHQSQAKYMKSILQANDFNCTIVETIKEAKSILTTHNFFMAFLDVNLPDGHGFKVLDLIIKNKLDLAIAFISASKEPDIIIKSFKLGAVDYLIKPVSEEALLTSINNAVMKKEGELSFIERNLRLIEENKLLTPREYEILAMIASGETYKKIPDKLFISQNTFKVHTKSIFQKLRLNGRTDIVYQLNCCDISEHLTIKK